MPIRQRVWRAAGDLPDMLRGEAGNESMNAGTGADGLVGGVGGDTLARGVATGALRFGAASRMTTTFRTPPGRTGSEVSATNAGGSLEDGMKLIAEGRCIQHWSGMSSAPVHVAHSIDEADVQRLWWDADGMGLGGRVLIATLMGVTSLGMDDIGVIT